jgi:hypothetical protein
MWRHHPWDGHTEDRINEIMNFLLSADIGEESPLVWDDVYPDGWYDDVTPKDDPSYNLDLGCKESGKKETSNSSWSRRPVLTN